MFSLYCTVCDLTNIHHMCLISVYFLQGNTELTWYGRWVMFFQVEHLSIFLSLLSHIFLSYNMFLILFLSRYAGNRSSLSRNKKFTVFFFPAFELLICVSLCDLSFHEPTPRVVSHKLLATVAGYHIYGPQGLETRLKETDREMMMRVACQGEIDLFFPPFFPGHVGLFPLICAFSICRQL